MLAEPIDHILKSPQNIPVALDVLRAHDGAGANQIEIQAVRQNFNGGRQCHEFGHSAQIFSVPGLVREADSHIHKQIPPPEPGPDGRLGQQHLRPLSHGKRAFIAGAHIHGRIDALSFVRRHLERIDLTVALPHSPVQGFQCARCDGVITVHKKQIFSPRRFQTSVARPAGALVFLMDHADQFRVSFGVFIADLRRNAVRGAVIHQNDLAIPAVIGQN